MLTVGARLTDFATASHSLFANPGVRFASINVNPRDADRLGATGIIADARQALAALADAAAAAGTRAPAAWRARAEQVSGEWAAARAAALDPTGRSTRRRQARTWSPAPTRSSPRASSSGSSRSTRGPATW